LVVRPGATYDATNRLTLPAVEERRLYCLRAQSEAVSRVCAEQRRLTSGQAHSERALLHQMTCCLVA
jgi:hypothetical protein